MVGTQYIGHSSAKQTLCCRTGNSGAAGKSSSRKPVKGGSLSLENPGWRTIGGAGGSRIGLDRSVPSRWVPGVLLGPSGASGSHVIGSVARSHGAKSYIY